MDNWKRFNVLLIIELVSQNIFIGKCIPNGKY